MRGKEGNHVFRIIWAKKWPIVISCFLAAIIAYTATLFITPKYEATAVILPSNTGSADDMLNKPQFGYDVDADWLLQILKSNYIRDSLTETFNLVSHYNIDTNDLEWRYDLKERYEDNISFERTFYMSLLITVKDKDPELAAAMANEIVRLVDVIKSGAFKKNMRAILKSREENYFDKLRQVNQLTDSIISKKSSNANLALTRLEGIIRQKTDQVNRIRSKISKVRSKYGLHDLNHQVDVMREHLTEAQARLQLESGKLAIYEKKLPANDSLRMVTQANVEGTRNEVEQLKSEVTELASLNHDYNSLNDDLNSQLILLNQYRTQLRNISSAYEPGVDHIRMDRLKSQYNAELGLLNNLKKAYDLALYKYNEPVPGSYVVSPAEVSYKEVSPKTTLIVVAAVLLTAVFAISIVLFQYRVSETREKEEAVLV